MPTPSSEMWGVDWIGDMCAGVGLDACTSGPV